MSCPAGFTVNGNAPRASSNAAATETVRPGDPFRYWDYNIIWTENHLPASRLEPLRFLGDNLADEALNVLRIKPGEDASEVLMKYTSRPESEQESPAPRLFLESMMTVPDWVDWEQVCRGQAVFWRYCLFIVPALFHFSLVGGFAVHNISKVLSSTGYITGSKSRKRIYETTQFILDVVYSLDNLQPQNPTGVAWNSTLQIRLLHANVRMRLSRASRVHSKPYEAEKLEVPINQEELLVTILSFSNINWRIMEKRMNTKMTAQERSDYLHLWRYVGHLVGVNDVFNVMTSPERADACMDSILIHLSDPNIQSGKMCAAMLKQVTPLPRVVTTITSVFGIPDPIFGLHLAISESLFGQEYWTLSGLGAVAQPYRWIWKAMLCLFTLDLRAATFSEQWLQVRTKCVKWILCSLIAREKRTRYTLKELPQDHGRTADNSEAGRNYEKGEDRNWVGILVSALAAIASIFFWSY